MSPRLIEAIMQYSGKFSVHLLDFFGSFPVFVSQTLLPPHPDKIPDGLPDKSAPVPGANFGSEFAHDFIGQADVKSYRTHRTPPLRLFITQ
jgi:hypothetical protein